MTTKEHLSKHDREIAEIRENNKATSVLIRQTMILVNRNTRDIRTLAAKIDDFVDSLRRGGTNGHPKRRIQ